MYIDIVSEWDSSLSFFSASQKDVYYSEDYVKMSSGKNETPLCFICREDDKVLLFPFLRKQIGDYYDFETPYGYGGPIANTDDLVWIKRSLSLCMQYFKDNSFIAGFFRFHPLLKNADLCRDIFTVIDDRKTVVIDTSVEEDSIWMNQISSKNRNMIRKAEKNGLAFERDDDFKYIEQFKVLYDSTMERLEADDFYFFDDNYYDSFCKHFKNKGFIGCVKKENEVIGAALYMINGSYGHYHLAGSKREYASLGTNNLLLWKVACEMHKEGVKEFHLGGGTDSDEENSLFKFKKSFSKNIRQFSIGKAIFNEKVYNEICSEWERKNPDKKERYGKLLLKYRY